MFGVRLSLLHNSRLSDKTTFAVTAQGAGETYRTYRLFSIRTSGIAGLGGGSGGLEGALGATIAVGIRVPLGEHHGPIIRVGLGGELLGNSQFYYSNIDLPTGEIGYQYISGHTIFEVGGYAALHGAFGRVDANFMHIVASNTDPGTGVDVLRGTACGFVNTKIGICADAMFVHGDEQPPAADDCSEHTVIDVDLRRPAGRVRDQLIT